MGLSCYFVLKEKHLEGREGNFQQLGHFNNLTLGCVCLMVGDRADETRRAVYNPN